MADSTLIPPVGHSRPIPKPRSIPGGRERHRKPPQQPVPEKPKHKKDGDRPSIDEYA